MLQPEAAERWFVEDEPVYSHIRDPDLLRRSDTVSECPYKGRGQVRGQPSC